VEEYEEAVEAIAARGLDATISIKLSQLGQTVDRDACVANLNRILDRAQAAGVQVEGGFGARTTRRSSLRDPADDHVGADEPITECS
jgi:hypothetical protein